MQSDHLILIANSGQKMYSANFVVRENYRSLKKHYKLMSHYNPIVVFAVSTRYMQLFKQNTGVHGVSKLSFLSNYMKSFNFSIVTFAGYTMLLVIFMLSTKCSQKLQYSFLHTINSQRYPQV